MDKIEEIIAARIEYDKKQRIIQKIINDRARMSFENTNKFTKTKTKE